MGEEQRQRPGSGFQLWQLNQPPLVPNNSVGSSRHACATPASQPHQCLQPWEVEQKWRQSLVILGPLALAWSPVAAAEMHTELWHPNHSNTCDHKVTGSSWDDALCTKLTLHSPPPPTAPNTVAELPTQVILGLAEPSAIPVPWLQSQTLQWYQQPPATIVIPQKFGQWWQEYWWHSK